MSVLLRQAHGFEGLAAVEEDPDALDLAVGEVPDVRAGNVAAESDAARPPAHVEKQEAENAVSPYWLQPFDGDPEIRTCIEDIGEESPDSIRPLVDAFDRRDRGLQSGRPLCNRPGSSRRRGR